MTAAEENLFRRLLSLCDAQDRLTPVIHAEDVRAFEALTDQLHYLRLANVKGTYALTPAGAAARRTLFMQDEQRAREEALQAQVESFRQQLIQVQRQAAEAAEQHLSLDEALRVQEESFRQQLIQVQRQSADALERASQELAEYKAQQQAYHALQEQSHAETRRKDLRQGWIQFSVSIFFTVIAVVLGAYLEFDQALLHWLFNLFHP